MEGNTYNFILAEEKSEYFVSEQITEKQIIDESQKHKIKISASSIAKIGGK